jgi:hypothetical protein
MAETGEIFSHNVILFGRLLRGLGLNVNTERMMDFLNALQYVQIGNKADFYYTARCLLVRRQEDIPLFDQAFEAFWQNPRDRWRAAQKVAASDRSKKPAFIPPPLKPPSSEIPGNGANKGHPQQVKPVIQVVMTYSDREMLKRKDFTECSAEELEEIKGLISNLVWQLGTRRSRRLEPGKGRQLDLRRTLRRNFKYGGEVLEWAYRHPKNKNRPLVIIADISGSMERYTQLLLHFIYSLSEGLDQRVEAFVFSTRLTRISRQLHGRNVEKVLRQVSLLVPDWAGGTRIGEALKRFNFQWSRRVLGQGAVVLLISDGWDRGSASLLSTEIARLQRSCYRLIWLNPLLGYEQYQPLARGMQAALPYIDDFMPVHNLASLEDLAQHLHLIERTRGIPRQL